MIKASKLCCEHARVVKSYQLRHSSQKSKVHCDNKLPEVITCESAHWAIMYSCWKLRNSLPGSIFSSEMGKRLVESVGKELIKHSCFASV